MTKYTVVILLHQYRGVRWCFITIKLHASVSQQKKHHHKTCHITRLESFELWCYRLSDDPLCSIASSMIAWWMIWMIFLQPFCSGITSTRPKSSHFNLYNIYSIYIKRKSFHNNLKVSISPFKKKHRGENSAIMAFMNQDFKGSAVTKTTSSALFLNAWNEHREAPRTTGWQAAVCVFSSRPQFSKGNLSRINNDNVSVELSQDRLSWITVISRSATSL